MTPSVSNVKRVTRGLLALALALALLFTLEVFSRLLLEGYGADGPRRMIDVSIPAGASIDQIADVLRAKGLVEHPQLFRWAVRVMGADTKIQAGNMQLSSGLSVVELIRQLTRAKSVGTPVLIREGITSMDIAGILAGAIGVDSAQFMAVVHDTALVRELGLNAPSLEGYLYPDTYIFAANTDLRRLARRMVANWRMHLPADAQSAARALGMSLNDIMTMASIVEWETMAKSEARTISSVYHNRLRKGMLLQADPTVAYALGKGPSRLYFSDLKVDSPYNTYKFVGLPPGPINNPGAFSIQAALHPEKTPYLFFVAQGDGTHAFSTNFNDHLSAKQVLDDLRREHDAKRDSTVRG